MLYGGAKSTKKKKTMKLGAHNTPSTFREDILPATPTHFSGVVKYLQMESVDEINWTEGEVEKKKRKQDQKMS